MLDISDDLTAADELLLSQLRVTPTGLTADEIMVDPSNLHGHQGNNDVYILNKAGDNFQLFRSHDDMTFIKGTDDTASFWGGGNETVYDEGIGTTLRFSELDGHQVKVYGFQNDKLGKIELYNPTAADLTAHPDGTGGTILGYLDFVGAATISPAQISIVHTPTNPSQGGLI